MAARVTDIFSLLIITFFCVGLVEGGYQALEYFVLRPPVAKTESTDVLSVTQDLVKNDDQKEIYDYRVILQRNLFGPPPGKAEPVVKSSEEQLEVVQPTSLNIVLMGTINGGTEANRAIILDKSSNKQELYEVGDAIQGALVKEILRGKVILTFNGRDEMLDMSEAANVRPSYAVPVQKLSGGTQQSPTFSPPPGVAQPRRQVVPPRRTPRRVTSRPRAIQPSQTIDNQ